jgi:hypothetical protein
MHKLHTNKETEQMCMEVALYYDTTHLHQQKGKKFNYTNQMNYNFLRISSCFKKYRIKLFNIIPPPTITTSYGICGKMTFFLVTWGGS